MNEKLFDSVLLKLGRDVGPHDYDLLFGSSATSNRSGKRQSKFQVELFETISDIESEVIEKYFSGGHEGPREDRLDTTIDHVIATQVDLQEKRKQNEEAEKILIWTDYCQDSGIEPEKLTELINLPDHIFDAIISSANLSTDTLKKIVFAACEFKDISPNKLGTLAQYGLLPKVCESDVPIRTVFPIYQKLLATTSSLTMLNRVLLPMFKINAVIPRPFYGNVDKELFFKLSVTWMNEEYIELTTTSAATLNHLLEDIKDMDDQNHEIIIKLLDRSVRYRPNDDDVSFFFWLVVSKFGENISEVNLKLLQTLNHANETKMKDRIHSCIEKQLANFSSVKHL